MKTKYALSLLTLALIFSFSGIQTSTAQNVPTGIDQKESMLCGSRVKSENIIIKSDAIFVGEVMRLGLGDFKMAGVTIYRGTQVKVLQILRGTVSNSVSVTQNIIALTTLQEAPTIVGNSYIFFVRKNEKGQPDSYTALKILPASTENIAKVRALIATK